MTPMFRKLDEPTCVKSMFSGRAMKKNKGSLSMSGYARGAPEVPWWKEPTRDQWYAFVAAWLGWTLDAFDFTVFLFLLVPIAKEFNAEPEVAGPRPATLPRLRGTT